MPQFDRKQQQSAAEARAKVAAKAKCHGFRRRGGAFGFGVAIGGLRGEAARVRVPAGNAYQAIGLSPLRNTTKIRTT